MKVKTYKICGMQLKQCLREQEYFKSISCHLKKWEKLTGMYIILYLNEKVKGNVNFWKKEEEDGKERGGSKPRCILLGF